MKPLPTKTANAIYIAGSKTVDDWASFKLTLVPGSSSHAWQKAFSEYFYERLASRYLEPIKVLQENGSFQGEGFSIVAIQCSLIEFLESTIQGTSYRYLRRGDPSLGRYEYSRSEDQFVKFLTTRHPFAGDFSAETAADFYKSVRCGLLHEARTKNGWTIWARSITSAVVSHTEKIVYRDAFQSAVLEYIRWYETQLSSNRDVQEAFIRKFDSLCQ